MGKNLLFNNSNRLYRIFVRLSSYQKLFAHAISYGISLKSLAISQFPYLFKDAIEPPIVSLEFTNYCNLKCLYCTSSYEKRKKGFMSDEVFDAVYNSLKGMKPTRIQIVGNGESTIHPKFDEYISKLSKIKHYVSIVTNGNFIKEDTAEKLISSNLKLIDFSIDAGGKEEYEKSRKNGNYDKVIESLLKLKAAKKKYHSDCVVNIRIMVRPSQMSLYKKEMKFWKKYADRVMPQFLVHINNTEYSHDLFKPIQKNHNSYPKCSLPFKHIEVRHNGDVLLCYHSAYQLKDEEGLKIDNVLNKNILQLWNSSIMKQYRNAHRKRKENDMPICLGCSGC